MEPGEIQSQTAPTATPDTDLPPLVDVEILREALQLDRPPAIERIDAGHSNPTFLVSAGDSRWILRRPPRPPFAPQAHDVIREYRVLVSLREQNVRTPVPTLAREGEAMGGASFYLMEALDGLVLRDRVPAALDSPEDLNRIGVEFIDALAELHSVDPHEVDLGDPSRADGYLSRQVEMWAGQWERNQTREVAAVDAVTRYLRAGIPATPRPAIVHGDFKLDNVMFAPEGPARLIAILDWEMATIGDPLADLGFLTATWIDAGESIDRVGGLSKVTSTPGLPSRAELAERYARQIDLPLEHLRWYQALALWKLAILLEASYRRYLSGTAADDFFPTLAAGVPRIGAEALAASEGALV